MSIRYVGKLKDGTKFDSSADRLALNACVPHNVINAEFRYIRGSTFQTEIGVGKVIRGWDEGYSCS